jgi:hypothetical protein
MRRKEDALSVADTCVESERDWNVLNVSLAVDIAAAPSGIRCAGEK